MTDKKQRTPLEVAAHIFSILFSPLMSATYGIALSVFTTYLRQLDTSVDLALTGITFFVTAFIPALAILWLWRNGVISDPGLNEREGRTVPFIISAICFCGLAVYLLLIKAPVWLWTFPAGGAVAIIVCAIVNRWWKISGHMAGMGGIVAVAFRITANHAALVDMRLWLTAVILIAGIVGTSRIILHRHTLMQVLAGFTAGFLSVYLLSAI